MENLGTRCCNRTIFFWNHVWKSASLNCSVIFIAVKIVVATIIDTFINQECTNGGSESNCHLGTGKWHAQTLKILKFGIGTLEGIQASAADRSYRHNLLIVPISFDLGEFISSIDTL